MNKYAAIVTVLYGERGRSIIVSRTAGDVLAVAGFSDAIKAVK